MPSSKTLRSDFIQTVRVCSLSPVLPTPRSAHAGGVYVWRLHAALAEFSAVHYLVPDLPSNRPIMAATDARTFTVLKTQGGPARVLLTRAFNLLRRIDAQAPFLPVLPSLFSPRALKAIREADVLDFQWSDWAHWILLRVLNPRARTIVTLHDITSQSAERRRMQSKRRVQRIKWGLSRRLALCLEMAVLRMADHVVVFSDKDRNLLTASRPSNKVVVLHPPLQTVASEGEFYSPNKTVIFLAYFLRRENQEALDWLVDSVWPEVVREVPNAQLRVVGTGLTSEESARLDRLQGLRVEGFVAQLDDAYRNTHIAVVPLQAGAGVKFKSIDPLLRGLPVVTTSVGAEGIGGNDIFSAIADTPDSFARAIVEILQRPGASVAKARQTREWAVTRFGTRTFAGKVRSIYGAGPAESDRKW